MERKQNNEDPYNSETLKSQIIVEVARGRRILFN